MPDAVRMPTSIQTSRPVSESCREVGELLFIPASLPLLPFPRLTAASWSHGRYSCIASLKSLPLLRVPPRFAEQSLRQARSLSSPHRSSMPSTSTRVSQTLKSRYPPPSTRFTRERTVSAFAPPSHRAPCLLLGQQRMLRKQQRLPGLAPSPPAPDRLSPPLSPAGVTHCPAASQST